MNKVDRPVLLDAVALKLLKLLASEAQSIDTVLYTELRLHKPPPLTWTKRSDPSLDNPALLVHDVPLYNPTMESETSRASFRCRRSLLGYDTLNRQEKNFKSS